MGLKREGGGGGEKEIESRKIQIQRCNGLRAIRFDSI
jgi:hypothetical protein